MNNRTQKKVVYLESVAGIAGDMFTSAFLDAGIVTPEEIQEIPGSLGLKDVSIEIGAVTTAGMKATHLEVLWKDSSVKALYPGSYEHHHTTYQDIDRLIRDSELSTQVKAHARGIFKILADAEATVHGYQLDQVAFHEIGDIDSIIDVVLAGVCVDKISPAKFVASPVKLGRGTIDIKHGTYPIPPPASAQLVKGFQTADVPPAIQAENIELSTPTGLAIIRYLQPEFVTGWPAGELIMQGNGAGSTLLDGFPNIFRIVVLNKEISTEVSLPYNSGEIVEIQCNIDDQTGEQTGWLLQQLIDKEALDAYYIPAIGKKNRPAGILSVLTKIDEWQSLADWILRFSTTFGLRYKIWNKLELERTFEERETEEGRLRYKIGYTTKGEKLKEKPEFEDLARIREYNPDFKP